MDGISGEIIYIIIMLVIFIFSALKKKKGRGGEMPEPDREVENPMDEVFSPFKEIFGDDEEEEEKPQPAPVAREFKNGRKDFKDAPFVKEDYVFTSNTSPGDARRQRKNKTPGRQTVLKSEESMPNESEQTDSGLHEWFDLRKAVIHSEILKRPDY
ncbi:hypothetical protein [Marinilabilia rubra]|uniref:Uncharacterized protein n=1 Tax=Marinilabilia rubra TaxID=2162893 RepID=A0A2U2BD30_9BACT|nr:hypothetical protein [Marinilabilia rubra]PWE00974.1 hypothetical protein DDZ16_00345 [Marinilabilia rubra]